MSPFQPSFAFHIETCYLVCNASQTTAFCMECSTGLKGVDYIQFLPLRGAGGALKEREYGKTWKGSFKLEYLFVELGALLLDIFI